MLVIRSLAVSVAACLLAACQHTGNTAATGYTQVTTQSAAVRAVIRVESSGNPRALGRAGEIGLMQIKPATARGEGFRGAIGSRSALTGLWAPATNIRYGSSYLRRAFARHGNGCAGFSAYNRGIYAPTRCTEYGRRVLRIVNSSR